MTRLEFNNTIEHLLDRGILSVARMFIKQIEHGIIDAKDGRSSEAVSDFMFLYGTRLYYSNVSIYASLLGHLKQAANFNPKSKFYDESCIDRTFNPQMN